MFGYPISAVAVWTGVFGVLLILGIVLAIAIRSAKSKAWTTKRPSAASRLVPNITIGMDTGETSDFGIDISNEEESPLTEFMSEGLMEVVKELDGKVIFSVPPDVKKLLDSGQAAWLTAKDHPLQIVRVDGTKAAVVWTQQNWSLRECIDYVGSAWKMLSFLVGQMNSTRMRSTLANIHLILRDLRQYERDKALGSTRGNLQYLFELREQLGRRNTGESLPAAVQCEGIYRESLQSLSTYAIVLNGHATQLAAARLPEMRVNSATVAMLKGSIRDYRADAYIYLSSVYLAVASATVSAIIAGDGVDLAKTRFAHANDEFKGFERQDLQWWQLLQTRMGEFDGTLSWKSTKAKARSTLNAEMKTARAEIDQLRKEISRVLKEADTWIVRMAQGGKAGLRFRVIGDGTSVSRIEFLSPLA